MRIPHTPHTHPCTHTTLHNNTSINPKTYSPPSSCWHLVCGRGRVQLQFGDDVDGGGSDVGSSDHVGRGGGMVAMLAGVQMGMWMVIMVLACICMVWAKACDISAGDILVLAMAYAA